MGQMLLQALPLLLRALNTWLDWFFSSEQTTAREVKEADRVVQDFRKALKENDAAYVTGAAADLHDRVRQALLRS